MSLFSHSQIIKKNTIFIPKEYRAIFGWYQNLELYVSSLYKTNLENNLSNELIITPIAPMNRLDLWRLQLAFRDRKNLLVELTNLLKELNIDIQNSRVTTADQNKYLMVDMLIDNQLYKSKYDKDSITRKKNKYVYLDELKNTIVSEFIYDILFINTSNSIPVAKVKRNLPLYRSFDQLNKHGKDILKEGGIRIPSEIINDIRKEYLEKYPELKNLSKLESLPRASLVADFEANLVRAFIYFKNSNTIHVRVKARNRIGAISKICAVLNKNHFSIKQMYNRIIGSGEWALSDFLVHYFDPKRPESVTDSKLQSELKKAFNKENEYYDFETIFPHIKNFADARPKKKRFVKNPKRSKI